MNAGLDWTLTLHFSDCYFLARVCVVDTFLTFKINQHALLLNGIISHWRRDSNLETSEDFHPFSISSAETLILIYLKNISIYMRYTVLMQFSVFGFSKIVYVNLSQYV